MSRHGSPAYQAARSDPPDRVVLTRIQWWLALGALEFLSLSFCLDTERIAATGYWRYALKKLPDGIVFGLVAVGLTVLLAGFSAWNRLRQEIDRRGIIPPFPRQLFGLHLFCVAAFALSSWGAISQATSAEDTFVTALLMAVCLISGLAACVTWFAGLMPVELWQPSLPYVARGLAAAVPITIATWAIARTTRDSWLSLSAPTLKAVLTLLRMFGQTPVHPPNSLGVSLGGFAVEIDPACSGYQGFGVMAVFSAVYVWAFRRQLRFPQAWLLVPIALVASWCGNVLRIAALLGIGAYLSPAVALGGFHSQAGWLFLILVAVLFVGVTQRLTFFSVDRKHSLQLQDSAVAACLTPFLLWNVIGLVSMLTAADPAVDPLYPLRWLALLLPVWYWRSLYARLLAVDVKSFFGVLTGAIAFALWMLLEQWIPADAAAAKSTAETLARATLWTVLWLTSRIIGSCLAVPFLEELAFRGYLMRRVQAFRFEDVPFAQTAWPGLVISSLVFGLLHGERWFAGLLVGLIYGLTVRQTGRLSAGVIAHATTNALLTAYVLATGDYARWH